MRIIQRFFYLALLCILSACQPKAMPVKQESYVFGTKVEVTVYHEDKKQADAAISQVLRSFDQIHARFSVQEPKSEISQLNAAIAAGQAFIGSEEMAVQVRYAQKYYQLSGGWFNPAIGQYLKKWRFNEHEFSPEFVDKNTLVAISQSAPNPLDISIRLPEECPDAIKSNFDANPPVCFVSQNSTVALDFGGMGKGDALDQAEVILRKEGISSALINIGGNIMAIGNKPDGSKWQVALQHPREERVLALLDLNDGEAIGTSGDYQRYFKYQNKRYCHLINPFDANAACVKQSATVLVQKKEHAGLLSDVASKPLFFLKEGAVANKVMKNDFDIVDFFWVNNDGTIIVSSDMQKRIHWQGKSDTMTVLP